MEAQGTCFRKVGSMLPSAREQPGRTWVTSTAPVASSSVLPSACKDCF